MALHASQQKHRKYYYCGTRGHEQWECEKVSIQYNMYGCKCNDQSLNGNKGERCEHSARNERATRISNQHRRMWYNQNSQQKRHWKNHSRDGPVSSVDRITK